MALRAGGPSTEACSRCQRRLHQAESMGLLDCWIIAGISVAACGVGTPCMRPVCTRTASSDDLLTTVDWY